MGRIYMSCAPLQTNAAVNIFPSGCDAHNVKIMECMFSKCQKFQTLLQVWVACTPTLGGNMLVVALLAAAVALPVDERTLHVALVRAHLKPALLVKVVPKCLLSSCVHFRVSFCRARVCVDGGAGVNFYWSCQGVA